MNVKVVLVGDTSSLSPALLAMIVTGLADFTKYLNEDHSALEKQYREGLMSEHFGLDWYMDPSKP